MSSSNAVDAQSTTKLRLTLACCLPVIYGRLNLSIFLLMDKILGLLSSLHGLDTIRRFRPLGWNFDCECSAPVG